MLMHLGSHLEQAFFSPDLLDLAAEALPVDLINGFKDDLILGCKIKMSCKLGKLSSEIHVCRRVHAGRQSGGNSAGQSPSNWSMMRLSL